MSVILMHKTNFNCSQRGNVTKITYDGTNYVVTSNGVDYTYPAATYNIQILWK